MPTHHDKPWWELAGKPPPWDAQFDAEAERLRQLRAQEYAERLRRRDDKRKASSTAPPASDHSREQTRPHNSAL